MFSFDKKMVLTNIRYWKAIALFTITFLAVIFLGAISNQKAYSSNPSPQTVYLSGILRDFKDSHPDFERVPGQNGFYYDLDPDITLDTLDADGKPRYKGGSYSTTTQANFDQWYRDIAGINQKASYTINLQDLDGDGIYTYYNSAFFPLDGMAGFDAQGRKHNYHFTYQLHEPFLYKGGEIFEFKGDDDLWVYINGKKVIDIGGVHSEKAKSVNLDAVASTIGITPGNIYNFDLFFAERHTTHSNFKIETSIVFGNYAD